VLFRRIAVRNFRKLVSPAVIDGLGEGVTIIAGDNEEGKSTLLLAIRTGLFERHNLGGKAVEAMQPFGSSLRPEIRLDFEIDGTSYSITKGFAHRSSALLTTPNGMFEGPAAEEQLAELLTFRVPQRGESRPDDRGILGLFWLEQGRILEGLGFGEMGRSTLRSSLEEEVGDVLGGTRGRRLLEAATAKRDTLLTPTGRPRAELAAAIDAAEGATARVARLEVERRTYDQEIDDLARIRRELARIDTDKVLEKAQEALATAEEQAKALERLRQQDEAASQAVALAEAQVENARDRWMQRLAMSKTSTDREGALKSARATVVELEKETQSLVDRVDTARVALRAAIEARSAAEGRVALSQSRARVKALDEEIAELDRRLTEVDKLVADRTAAQERLVGIKIDKRAFEHIQRLESTMREARSALGAIATRVRFLPSGNQEVRKNDEEIPLGETVELTEATRFTLEGFGGIDIKPGASDLASRHARFREANNALGKALAATCVTDLVQARSQFEERTEAETAMKEANRLISAYAPEGVGALRAAQREKSAERLRLNEERDLSVAVDIGDPGTETRALASTRAGKEGARRALDMEEREHQQHATQIAVARQAAETIEEALAAAKGDLETARAGVSDADLAARLETALGSLTQKTHSKEKTEKQLAAANPEEIELRRNRAEATVYTVDAEQRRLRDSAIGLESRLAALGKNGIGEMLEEARGQAVQVVSRLDRLQADARAWDLLVGTLSSAERDAKEAFLEPVLKSIDPFLRLLLPGARLALDEETLEITGVTRDGREEPYAALSIGTREQLCILVRLAFAVYLRGKGYPAAVILDDALVYADDERFERMQLALRKAAETVQILILTCRPRDWRQFGAPIRHLAEATTAALEPA
jgi:DNA repair exonuclease SbcCD ATPase subunit